jgi:cytochrome c
MSRSRLAFLAAALLTGLVAGRVQAQTGEPCGAANPQTAQVKKACKDGGRDAVKALMKEVVKKAKAAGQDVNCKSCHTNLTDYAVKDGAVAELKKWL